MAGNVVNDVSVDTDCEPKIPVLAVDTSFSSRKRSQTYDHSKTAKRFNSVSSDRVSNKENRLAHTSTPRARSAYGNRKQVTPVLARMGKSGRRGFYGKKTPHPPKTADETPNRIYAGRRGSTFDEDISSELDETREDDGGDQIHADASDQIREDESNQNIHEGT